MKMNHFYGWRPDLPDFRDFKYAAPLNVLKKLPPMVDLSSQSPGVYNQESLGSCTAQAVAAAFEFNLIKQGAQVFTPSRLFIYYNERVMINTVNADSGAYLRDGLTVVSKLGACLEMLWPYSISEFTKAFSSLLYRSPGPPGIVLPSGASYVKANERLPCRRISICIWIFGFRII